MDLKRLRFFLTVAEELSFSRAARRLGVSQPVLSRGIKELEAYVGTELFVRSTTEVSLTAAGEVLLPKADQALLILNETLLSVRQIGKGRESTLDIGYLSIALNEIVGPALQSMRQTHPGVSLRPHEMSPRRQMDALRESKVDMAILALLSKERAADEFDTFNIFTTEIALVVSATDPIGKRESVDLTEMADRELISYSPAEFPVCEVSIDQLFTSKGITYEPIMRANSLQSAMAAVAATDAYTMMPFFGSSIAPEQVQFVKLDPEVGKVHITGLVRRNERRKCVLTFLQECRRIAQTSTAFYFEEAARA